MYKENVCDQSQKITLKGDLTVIFIYPWKLHRTDGARPLPVRTHQRSGRNHAENGELW